MIISQTSEELILGSVDQEEQLEKWVSQQVLGRGVGRGVVKDQLQDLGGRDDTGDGGGQVLQGLTGTGVGDEAAVARYQLQTSQQGRGGQLREAERDQDAERS